MIHRLLPIALAIVIPCAAQQEASRPPELLSDVITVLTPKGQLKFSVKNGKVAAVLDDTKIPDEMVEFQGGVVVIRGPDGHSAVDLLTDRSLLAEGRVTKKLRIGVSLSEVDAALATHLGLERDTTSMITSVEESMPASSSGLQPYDILVAIDGATPATQAELTNRLDGMKEGEPLVLSILRKGSKMEVAVTPKAVPEAAPTSIVLGDYLRRQYPGVPEGSLRYLDAVTLLDPKRGALRGKVVETGKTDEAGAFYLGSLVARSLAGKSTGDSAKVNPDQTKRLEELSERLDRLQAQLERLQKLLESK